MADTKITGLTNFDSSNTPYWPPAPASDVIPIVDVSDTTMAGSGTTKKISINNLLSSSPTATGAFTVSGLVTAGSATISGDLTVRTDKLVVTSTGVGAGTATPACPLEVYKNTNGQNRVFINNPSTGSGAYNSIDFTAGTSSNQILSIGSNNTASFPYTAGTLSLRSGSVNGMIITTGGSAAPIQFGINDTLAMTLNSTGLAVGTASATYRLDLLSTGYCESRIRSSGNGQQVSLRLETKNSDTTDCKILLGCGVTSNNQFLIQDTANTKNLYFINGVGNATNSHLWYSGGATATMTLDTSGNLLVGKSTAGSLGTVGHELKANGEVFATQSSSNNVATTFHAYSSGAAAYRFYVGMGGTVYATNTTISAISDARLKENVQDIDVGLGAILALKPRKFDWKEGKGKNIKGDRGFIAQEFEQVFPNLIDEWKDNAPEGETPYKSVRQDLIPVLVKAIQELTARVAALEA